MHKVMTLLPTSFQLKTLLSLISVTHQPVVPCKPLVTQNKLPSLWMGQNNTEMSLFHCNWSYLGKHKSIVSIIAMSLAPQRLFQEDSFASFHLPTDYYFHGSYFLQSFKRMHVANRHFVMLSSGCLHDTFNIIPSHQFSISVSQYNLLNLWNSPPTSELLLLKSFDWSLGEPF